MTIVPTPTFSIYKLNSTEKVESLQACHIERLSFKRENLPANICAKDGWIYQTIWESRIPEGMEEFEAIVSFQQHTFGRFAIVRIAKPCKEEK